MVDSIPPTIGLPVAALLWSVLLIIRHRERRQ
jgi:hypothetical protein